jgi:uncharacterized protein YPO0396
MGNALFGRPKDPEAPAAGPSTETAISKLDGQIRILEKRIDHTNMRLKNQQAQALAKGQAGDRAGALHHVNQTKVLEKDLKNYHGMLENLQIQRHTLEQASFQVDTLRAMEAATTSLAATSRQMPVEKAEEIVEATEEAKANVEEIQQVLLGPPRDTSEEEAELDAMLAGAAVPAAAVAQPMAAPPVPVPSELERELATLAAMDAVPNEAPPAARVAIAS